MIIPTILSSIINAFQKKGVNFPFKLPSVFVLPIFESLLKTGFTVNTFFQIVTEN